MQAVVSRKTLPALALATNLLSKYLIEAPESAPVRNFPSVCDRHIGRGPDRPVLYGTPTHHTRAPCEPADTDVRKLQHLAAIGSARHGDGEPIRRLC